MDTSLDRTLGQEQLESPGTKALDKIGMSLDRTLGQDPWTRALDKNGEPWTGALDLIGQEPCTGSLDKSPAKEHWTGALQRSLGQESYMEP